MTNNREEQIRNKAKELGQKYFPDSANIWARSNVEAAYVENACVEMAGWLDQYPNWISVKDELPIMQDNEWRSDDVFFVTDDCQRHYGFYREDGDVWFSSVIGFRTSEVTHWMPLPQLPRKEE